MPAQTPDPAINFAMPLPSGAAPISRSLACLMLFLAAFFWGAGNVANKTVLADVDPYTAVALRCLLASVVMLPFLSLEPRAGDHRAWRASAIRVSLLFAGALVLQQIAYQSTTVTNASFLVNTASILTPLVAWVLLRDRPPLRILVAGVVTLGGAFLMSGVDPATARMNPGDLACLGSALLYAGWMVALGQHAVRYGRPFSTSFVQFLTTAIVVAPAALGQAPRLADIGQALPEILVLGVFSTAAAFGLLTFAQRYVSASTAAILVSAESVFGAAGAYLLLDERIPPSGMLGAALILGAILMVATAAQPMHAAQTPSEARLQFRRHTPRARAGRDAGLRDRPADLRHPAQPMHAFGLPHGLAARSLHAVHHRPPDI